MVEKWLQNQSLSCCFFVFLLLLPFGTVAKGQSFDRNQYIYDEAQLLTAKEKANLQSQASQLGKKRNTAFIVVTVNGTDGKTLKRYVEDFYDKYAPGYDQPHGNTAILAIDMQKRNVYLAGFQKAEKYLDDSRLDQIREKITPDLSDGNYFQAFSAFLNTSDEYMNYKPGVNPENILFKWWFQLAAALVVAGVVVGLMAYRSGGRVTVNSQTYLNQQQSGVVNQYDNYLRKTVTMQKKPSNDTNSGSGGGGMTSGGFSHSGSGGKF